MSENIFATPTQCLQFSDFVTKSGDFFLSKRLATNLVTFPGFIGDFRDQHIRALETRTDKGKHV